MPIGFGGVFGAIFFPGRDFFDQGFEVGNAVIKALVREDGAFGFGHIQPAAVLGRVVLGRGMPREAFDEAPGLGGREGFGERSWFVGVERSAPDAPGGRRVILHQDDFFGLRNVRIR